MLGSKTIAMQILGEQGLDTAREMGYINVSNSGQTKARVSTMSTYILVDTANTFPRHVRGDPDTKVGMALHITLKQY